MRRKVDDEDIVKLWVRAKNSMQAVALQFQVDDGIVYGRKRRGVDAFVCNGIIRQIY